MDADRLTELASRMDGRLNEFVSTEEVPYSYGLHGDGDRKPNFPSLYLSRSTDPSLMKMPGEGSAMVRYRIKRREIDESREDGQPLYGASIEIQSLDPVADQVEETGLESTQFLKEFGSAGRQRVSRVAASLQGKIHSGVMKGSVDPALRTKLKITEAKHARALKRRNIEKMPDGVRPGSFYPKAGNPKVPFNGKIGKHILRGNDFETPAPASRYFAEARDRDGEGRFASGNIPGADDYAVAALAAKKKKAVGVMRGGALLARVK